jgi:hypothetical protein
VALSVGDRHLLPADSENVMAYTLTAIAVLGFILFGVIPFGPDWWRRSVGS